MKFILPNDSPIVINSFTYHHVTRDTLGQAIKATFKDGSIAIDDGIDKIRKRLMEG